MDMATAARRWTVEMVRSLPDDGNRYEVVDGMLLVTPTAGGDDRPTTREARLRRRHYGDLGGGMRRYVSNQRKIRAQASWMFARLPSRWPSPS